MPIPVTTVSVLYGTTYTLTAADPSGVAATYYSLDGTYPSIKYTVPLVVTTDCLLRFYSVDTVGNTEVVQNMQLKVGAPALVSPPTGTMFTGICNVPGTDDFCAAGYNGNIYKVKGPGFWNPVGVHSGQGAWNYGGAQLIAVPGTPYVYLFTGNGMYRSSNYGEVSTWSKIQSWNTYNTDGNTHFSNPIYCAAIDTIHICYYAGQPCVLDVRNVSGVAPVGGGRACAQSASRGIGAHADGSSYWLQTSGNQITLATNANTFTTKTMPNRTLGGYGEFYDYDGSNVIYAGVEGGRLVVYKTTNAFTTWTNVYTSQFAGVAAYPGSNMVVSGSQIIISCDRATHTSIVKSNDGGTTWTEVYYDLVATGNSINNIATSGNYTWTGSQRMHRSLDFGDSWPSI